MTNYLSSAKVKVYPSAYRGVDASNNLYDPEARIPSEKNVTSQLASITSKSFIVSPTIEDAIAGNDVRSWYIPGTFKFCIHGYLFEVTLDAWFAELGSATEIWACIQTANANKDYDGSATDYAATSLVALDDAEATNIVLDSSNTFKGLKFVTGGEAASMTGAGIYKLLVFKKVGTEWHLPTESYRKFTTTEIASVLDTSVSDKGLDEYFKTNMIEATTATCSSLSSTLVSSGTVECNNLMGYNNTTLTGGVVANIWNNKYFALSTFDTDYVDAGHYVAGLKIQDNKIELEHFNIESDSEIKADHVISTTHTTSDSSDYTCTTKGFTDGRYVKDLVFTAGTNPELKSRTAAGTETTVISSNNFKQMFLDLAYPVGTIYTSDRMIDDKCPIEANLGGTWERMQGKYLYPAGDGGSGTEYGSNAAYVVQHSHNMVQVDRTAQFATRPAGNDKANIISTNPIIGVKDSTFYFEGASDSTIGDTPFKHGLNMRSTNDSKYWLMTLHDKHNHTMQALTTNDVSGARLISSSDINTANMPASIGVYVWKRIS